MLSVQEREREIYREMAAVEAYQDYSPGARYLPAFLEMAGGLEEGASVLDAGCSSGKGALALKAAGLSVTMTDLTPDGLVDEARTLPFLEHCLWQPGPSLIRPGELRRWDWVFCCDVLEHIPPQFTMLVVRRLLDVCRRGVFLGIALQPDNLGAWVGKPLHQTVQPYGWWLENLKEIGTVPAVDGSRDLCHVGLYLVRP
jgi:2-polyprenyl-3-methyl-5-hydroxy-6-metoxy-1,4-benzoquinol methylase